MENGLVYYGMRCSYTKSSTNSTYTIRSYIGTLVDLVSILVSATNLLAKIGTSFIKRVCISAGITIAGGNLRALCQQLWHVRGQNSTGSW